MDTMRFPVCIPLILGLFVTATVADEADDDGDGDSDDIPRMVVVASRAPEPLAQVAASVGIVDRDEIERHLLQDIGGLVRYIPGVRVDDDATRFGRQGFSIRGLGGNRVRVEVDGVPLPDTFAVGQFASAGRDLADLEVVRRVEILRGPASTLYGSDALAGIVAFTTLDPSDLIARGRRSAYVGTRGMYSTTDHSRMLGASWAAATASGVESMLVIARRQGHEAGNRSWRPEDTPNPADYGRTSGLGKLVFDAGTASTVTLTLDHARHAQLTDVHSQLFGPGRFATTYQLDADDSYTRNRISAGIVTIAPITWVDQVGMTLYHQQSEVRQDSRQFRLADAATPFESLRTRRFQFEQRELGLDIVAQSRHESATISHWQVYGFQYGRTGYEGLRDGSETNLNTGATSNVVLGENLPVRDFPNTVATRLALFWQDEIGLGRLSATPGLRIERYRLDAQLDPIFAADFPALVPADLAVTSVTPKLAFRWYVGDDSSLFVQFARGFRAPPFGDVNIGLSLPVFNYEVRPNPDLRPERSRGVEVGWRWRGTSAHLAVSVYENRYTDLIESRANLGVDPGSGALVFQSVNRDRARIRGAEAELDLNLRRLNERLNGWHLTAAVAWAHGDDTARNLPLNSVDPLTAVIGAQWRAADDRAGLEIVGRAIAAKRRVDDSAGPLFRAPGSFVTDVFAWFEPVDGVRINLAVLNIADRRYWDWGKIRGIAAGAPDLGFYTQPGRSFSASIGIGF